MIFYKKWKTGAFRKNEEKKIQNTINACESIGKEIAF